MEAFSLSSKEANALNPMCREAVGTMADVHRGNHLD
jgi:hypothetical protein